MLKENLARLRKKAGLTQDDVADMLNVKRQTYSAYERGVSIPDAITLKKIAKHFGVSTDHLLSSEQEQKALDDDIRFALFGGSGKITDEMYEDVKRYAAFVRARREQEKKDGANKPV